MGDKRAPEQADIMLSCIQYNPDNGMTRHGSKLHLETQNYKKGIFISFSYRLTHSRHLGATGKPVEDRCSPRAGTQGVDNQAPDCGKERNYKRAFPRTEILLF